METIEGLHYIFDRYTFLNNIMEENNRNVRIDVDSPTEKIRKAIKLAMALYHPDRLEHSAKDMKEDAKRKRHLLDECKQFLLNETVRPLYTERLRQFQTEKPDFVSTTGVAIVDIYSERFDVDSLLSDQAQDTENYENHAKSLLQYDEARFEQMSSLYKSMPDNEQIRSLYRDALTTKYIYFGFLEDAAWSKLGFHNRKKKADGWIIDAENYTVQVEKALDAAKNTEIPDMLQQRGGVAQIGLAPLPLLLTYNEVSGAAPQQNYALMKPEEQAEILAKMTEAARSNFQDRSNYVLEIAQQKQKILEELVTLTPVRLLTSQDATDPIHHFYLAEPDKTENVTLRLILDASTGNVTPEPLKESPLGDLIAAGLKSNSHAVTRNKELTKEEFLLEIASAANRVYTQIQEQENTGQTPPHRPAPAGP